MSSLFKTWREDIPAGLVVFLVAVPLCLGIASASEAPLFSGLIAGIVGGIVIGAISGSSLGVSGPAAGLTAIVASAITDLGSFELFLTCVVIAGVFQLILGFLRAGFISNYFPNVVIKGMLAAIGIIIILKQLPHAVGYDKDPEGDEAFFQVDGESIFSELVHSLNFITWPAVIITVVSLVILICWEKKFIKRTFLRFIPGPMVVVLLGILFTLGLQGTEWALISEHRVDLGVSGKGFTELFTFPDFSQLGDMRIYTTALILAVVASLETLLSVEATDKLDPERRETSGNRELVAQGAGNIVSGMIGGLPLTQVIVRSSVNINSGGRNKLGAIFHGLLIATAVVTIPGVMNYIPFASLAAVLLQVGYKLAKPKMIMSIFKEGWLQFIPFALTVIFVVRLDLLSGVAIGLASSVIISVIQWLTLKDISKKQVALKAKDQAGHYHLELPDFISFVKKPAVIKALNEVPENGKLKVDLSNVQIISQDVEDTIHDFKEKAEAKNISIDIIPKATDLTN